VAQETKPWWRQALPLLIGAFLAGTVGIFTAWYTFNLQDNAAKAKAETERQSVIAASQAEIELNLIKLTTRLDVMSLRSSKSAH
jgi:hypothetical protein